MARRVCIAPPGVIYHVMNRRAGKFIMQRTDADFAALEHSVRREGQAEQETTGPGEAEMTADGGNTIYLPVSRAFHC